VGLAHSLPHRRVVAIDGDGSLMLGLSSLALLGHAGPPNLALIVVDNESYMAIDGLPSPTKDGGVDLAATARACGVPFAVETRDLISFEEAASTAVSMHGCAVVVAKVEMAPGSGPTGMDGRENKYRFVRFIEGLEDRRIIQVSFMKSTGIAREGRS
jgi:sulfopyruvate decarboxylase subunit beta